MITPLSQRDLEALRMEVEADTIIFDTVHRIRRAEGNASRGGLVLGMLATLAFALVWKDFFSVLIDIPAPDQLREVAKEHTDVAMYAIGLLCPLFFLLVAVQAGTHLMRAFLRRRIVSMVGSLALMTCAGGTITLVARQQPIAAIVIAVAGLFLGVAFNALGEARGSGRGNGQASG